MTLTTVPKAFDARPWNLLMGTALLAGCSPRLAADEQGESSTSSDSTDEDDDDDDDTDPTGPECNEHEDCFWGYCDNGICVECIFDYNCGYTYYGFCNNGVCDSNAPECYQYDPCPTYSYCDYSYGYGGNCVELEAPPPECEPGLIGIPTSIEPGAAPLALSFADLDADGRDELVIATAIELLIYESGDDSPAVIPRDDPSAVIQAMVAGQFDAQLGEDLVLSVGSQLHRYSADGVGGFSSQSVGPSPLAFPSGLLAGDFDGVGPTDLLVWGDGGALLDLGDATVPLLDDPVSAAAAFEQSSPEPGILLAETFTLHRFDLTGAAVGTATADYPNSLAALSAPELRRFVSSEWIDSWSAIWLWDASTLARSGIAHPLADHHRLAAGDFDGDQADDLATVSGTVTLVLRPLAAIEGRGEPCLAIVELDADRFAYSIAHAVGDHDGDGDDELAVALDSGAVAILDGE